MFDKKALILGCLIPFLMAMNSNAAAESSHKTIRIASGVQTYGIPLQLEVAAHEKVSLGLYVAGYYLDVDVKDSILNRKITYQGGSTGLYAKFYVNHNVFTDGWYIKPAIQGELSKMSAQYSFDETKFFAIAPSVSAGYDWVWASGFSLGLGFGAQYKHIFENSKMTKGNIEKIPGFMLKGIMPVLEFAIGFAL